MELPKLCNDEAAKAQVLYWLHRLDDDNTHNRKVVGWFVYHGAEKHPLSMLVAELEALQATCNAALRMIDEMREPPMDLDETAGMN